MKTLFHIFGLNFVVVFYALASQKTKNWWNGSVQSDQAAPSEASVLCVHCLRMLFSQKKICKIFNIYPVPLNIHKLFIHLLTLSTLGKIYCRRHFEKKKKKLEQCFWRETYVPPPTSLNRHIIRKDCIYNKLKVTIYLYVSLVKIHPFLNEIGCWQAIF